jgi:cytochrome c5
VCAPAKAAQEAVTAGCFRLGRGYRRFILTWLLTARQAAGCDAAAAAVGAAAVAAAAAAAEASWPGGLLGAAVTCNGCHGAAVLDTPQTERCGGAAA